MSEDEAELRRLFGALTRETGRRDPDEHPAIETLTAYQANELSPEDDRKIQEHFAICEHCAELLLDLERVDEPIPADAPADFEAAEDWRRLRERIGIEKGPVAKKGASGRPWMSYLAATFALISVASLLYAWSLRERLTEPQINARMASLQVEEGARGEDSPEAITLPEGDEEFLFISLTPSSLAEADYKEYRLEILDATERIVWSKQGLLLSDNDTFDIALPRPFLTSKRYVLRVLGVEPGAERLVGEYVLNLTDSVPDSQLQ